MVLMTTVIVVISVKSVQTLVRWLFTLEKCLQVILNKTTQSASGETILMVIEKKISKANWLMGRDSCFSDQNRQGIIHLKDQVFSPTAPLLCMCVVCCLCVCVRETDRPTDRQAGRQAGGQAGGQAGRERERERERCSLDDPFFSFCVYQHWISHLPFSLLESAMRASWLFAILFRKWCSLSKSLEDSIFGKVCLNSSVFLFYFLKKPAGVSPLGWYLYST